MRLAMLAAVLGVVLVAPSTPPVTVAAATTGSTAGWSVSVPLARRTLPVRPGYRPTPAGPVLAVQQFTAVGTLRLPPSRRPGEQAVVAVTLRVDAPVRVALSVRAWCSVGRPPGSAPDARSPADILVIGQNPVPGRSRVQRASRTLAGRAVVDLSAVGTASSVPCVVQVSPRTESVTGSRMTLVGGSFSATRAQVLTRAGERSTLLVGPPADPPFREVARTGAAVATGRVRVEGEAELTTCALGYHRCGRGAAPSSVAEVVLLLDDVTADGRVCRAWRGSGRRVTITPAVHHVKVAAPALVVTARCGSRVRAALRVVHVSGNAVEVEPTLGLPGEVPRVQTHTWVETA